MIIYHDKRGEKKYQLCIPSMKNNLFACQAKTTKKEKVKSS
jgi:hypothetical protein